ncbi:MAG: sugar ABC transporter substrate-binding protein [Proteiniphilum sp.]|nr:sugar ABC transporter substrate-binding protein [Proteiniphilum sp.]
MKLVKTVSIILVLVLIALPSITAQGQKDDSDTITLNFASWSILEKGTQGYFEELKSDFEQENPGIEIEYQGYPYGGLKTQALIMANAGEAPDIIQSARSWYPSFVIGGYVTDMSKLMGDAYMDDIFPEILADMEYDGGIYGIPWKVCPFVMFYNKELFRQAGLNPEQPPRTYEEALEYATEISKLRDSDGNKVFGLGQTTGAVPVSGGSVLSMMFSFGGGLTDENGNVDIDNANNIAAFSFLAELDEKGFNPEGALLKDLRNLFAIGRLGMYFDQMWGMTGVYAINPDIRPDVGMSNPLGGNGKAPGSTLEAHLLLVSEDSRHKEAAAKFIEFATSPEQISKYYQITPFLLPRESQVEVAENYSDNPFIVPVLDYAETINEVKKDGDMENVFIELTNTAQEVTVGGVDPAKAVRDLEQRVRPLLE